MRNTKTLFLLFTLIAIGFYLAPALNCQTPNAIGGDLDRDLYSYFAITKGDIPTQDFFFNYGPFMPYLYANSCLLLGGVTIKTVLLVKFFLLLILYAVFYYISLKWLPPPWALLSTFWLAVHQPHFFHTYNYWGALIGQLAVLLLTLRYFYAPSRNSMIMSLLIILCIGLTKINFGFSTLLAYALSIVSISLIQDRKQLFSIIYVLLIGSGTVILYWFYTYQGLTQGLSLDDIHQVLPYTNGIQKVAQTNYLQALQTLIRFFTKETILCLLAALGWILYLVSIGYKKNESIKEKIVVISILLTFYISVMHEFIVSNVMYRSYWGKPFELLILFFSIRPLILKLTQYSWTKWAHALLFIALSVIILLNAKQNIDKINSYKQNKYFLNAPKSEIYLSRTQDWIETTNDTVKYLKENLKDDELFFALPCNAHYYFLLNKKSPTWQNCHKRFNKPSQAQELKTIQDLIKNDVQTVVVSYYFKRHLPSKTELCRTQCPRISDYIITNYTPAIFIGNKKKGFRSVIYKKNPPPSSKL